MPANSLDLHIVALMQKQVNIMKPKTTTRALLAALLAALIRAAEAGGFNYTINDSWYDDYGSLRPDEVAGRSEDGAEGWLYWVNYPDEPAHAIANSRSRRVEWRRYMSLWRRLRDFLGSLACGKYMGDGDCVGVSAE